MYQIDDIRTTDELMDAAFSKLVLACLLWFEDGRTRVLSGGLYRKGGLGGLVWCGLAWHCLVWMISVV